MVIFFIVILILLLAAWALVPAKKHRVKHKHEGGMSSIDQKVIQAYLEHLHKQRNDSDWKPSVKALAETIYNDPAIRLNWEHGISISENLRAKNYTGKDVLSLLNVILSEGPKYTNYAKNP